MKFLQVLHYTRLQFCLLAIVASASISEVLTGQILWQPIFIVGLGTYVVYSLDNLLDWSGEKHLLPAIEPIWKPYFIWCVVTIPLALLTILFLAIQSNLIFFMMLATFGLISGVAVLLTKQFQAQHRSTVALLAERLIDSGSWALVLVLTPVLYDAHPMTAQVGMTVLYAWYLSWTIVVIWDLTRATTEGHFHATPVLSDVIDKTWLIKSLQGVSILAIVLHLVYMYLGFFPSHSVSVVLTPVVSFVLCSLSNKLRYKSLLYSNLFVFVIVCGCLLTIASYILAKSAIF